VLGDLDDDPVQLTAGQQVDDPLVTSVAGLRLTVTATSAGTSSSRSRTDSAVARSRSSRRSRRLASSNHWAGERTASAPGCTGLAAVKRVSPSAA
jgi:hypothetical protein